MSSLSRARRCHSRRGGIGGGSRRRSDAKRRRSLCTHTTKKTKADVLNRGFGGYETRFLATYMLKDLFDVAHPKMAVLFVGVKDTLMPYAAA